MKTEAYAKKSSKQPEQMTELRSDPGPQTEPPASAPSSERRLVAMSALVSTSRTYEPTEEQVSALVGKSVACQNDRRRSIDPSLIDKMPQLREENREQFPGEHALLVGWLTDWLKHGEMDWRDFHKIARFAIDLGDVPFLRALARIYLRDDAWHWLNAQYGLFSGVQQADVEARFAADRAAAGDRCHPGWPHCHDSQANKVTGP